MTPLDTVLRSVWSEPRQPRFAFSFTEPAFLESTVAQLCCCCLWLVNKNWRLFWKLNSSFEVSVVIVIYCVFLQVRHHVAMLATGPWIQTDISGVGKISAQTNDCTEGELVYTAWQNKIKKCFKMMKTGEIADISVANKHLVSNKRLSFNTLS